MGLRDKCAVVTGASRGLGRAIALGLAGQGARVALVARDEEALQSVACEITEAGGWARVFSADLVDPTSVTAMAAMVIRAIGCPDILVNNAGMGGPLGLIIEISYQDWQNTLRVNLDSMFLVTQAFLPEMMQRGSGNIINVTSGAGKRLPFSSQRLTRSLAYSVSKFGVEGLTQGLAAQLYPYGICVNALSPGPLDTRLHENSPPKRRSNLRDPMECTELILYLARQTCQSMTGESFSREDLLQIQQA